MHKCVKLSACVFIMWFVGCFVGNSVVDCPPFPGVLDMAVTTVTVVQITIVEMETTGMTPEEEITIVVALTITAGTLTRGMVMIAAVQATLQEVMNQEEEKVITTDEVIDVIRMRETAESRSQKIVKKAIQGHQLKKAPSRLTEREQSQSMKRSMETLSMRSMDPHSIVRLLVTSLPILHRSPLAVCQSLVTIVTRIQEGERSITLPPTIRIAGLR